MSSDIPIVAEIPSLENPNEFITPNERSVKAEAFRILCTNINYIINKPNAVECKVVYVTSAIKGEGKTLISLNLSMAYASLKKKVLLIGADLRNPQLHSFLNVDKNVIGLSDFLYNPEMDWKECIQNKMNKETYLDVCYGGEIPVNAAQLIASDGFSKFLSYAKKQYDYIIVDTAPTIQVVDTLLISEYADATIFITRSKYTDKKLIQFSKELSTAGKLKNMSYVLNDVSFDNGSGYNYGYNYDYGTSVKKKRLFSFKNFGSKNSSKE